MYKKIVHVQKQNVFCLSILLFFTIFKNFQFSEKRDLLSAPTVLHIDVFILSSKFTIVKFALLTKMLINIHLGG